MNYLKLAKKGWAGYTGNIGTIPFKNGISEHPVPRVIADRLGAAMEMIECDEDGNEIVPAGAAHRLVAEAHERAPVIPPLHVVTEQEQEAENRQLAIKALKPPVDTFYTTAELEAIAEKSGIKGLREIGTPWGVRGKAIPDLIAAILGAQAEFLKHRDEKLAEKVAAEETAREALKPVDPVGDAPVVNSAKTDAGGENADEGDAGSEDDESESEDDTDDDDVGEDEAEVSEAVSDEEQTA